MKLYKYVTAERIDVLEGKHIRFTQPKYLNDPFDLQPKLERLLPEDALEEIAQEASSNLSVHKTLKSKVDKPLQAAIDQASPEQRVKLEEFQEEVEEMFQQTPEQKIEERNLQKTYKSFVLPIIKEQTEEYARKFPSPFTKDAGVLSLTEKPDNLLMWAHYADSHRGFVVEFDGSHNFFDFPNKPGEPAIQKVVYRERKSIKHFSDLRSNEDVWINLFITKSKIWEYEQEWRLVKSLNDADKTIGNDIYLFAFPAECVTRIILGHSMSYLEKIKFLDLIGQDEEYKHVELAQATIRNDTDDLSITPFGVKHKLDIFEYLLVEAVQQARKLMQHHMWFTNLLFFQDVRDSISTTTEFSIKALEEIRSGKKIPEATADDGIRSTLLAINLFPVVLTYFEEVAASNILRMDVCAKSSSSASIAM